MQSLVRYRGTFFLLGLIFLFAAIAFLRGDVGTDTHNYEIMFRGFMDDYIWDGREPGFVALGIALASIMPTVEIAVRATSIVTFGLIAIYVIKGDQNERYFFIAFFLPNFVYQYSMNTLRIGLAVAIILLATQMIRKGNRRSGLSTGSLALLFHYSSFLLIAYLVASQRSWLKFYSIFLMLMALVASSALYLVLDFYILAKVDGYVEKTTNPTVLAGSSVIIPISIILIGMALGKLPSTEKFKLAMLAILFLLASWTLLQFTYAGTRLLALVNLLAPLSILVSYSRLGLSFEKKIKFTLFIGGLIAAYFKFRAYQQSRTGWTPWMPYETWVNFL